MNTTFTTEKKRLQYTRLCTNYNDPEIQRQLNEKVSKPKLMAVVVLGCAVIVVVVY